VGKKKKNLKVKDQKDYEFDNERIVMDIWKIYVNMNESDEFWIEVYKDGR
jgi:hypothetical protein